MSTLRLTIFIGSFTVGGGQQVVYELLRKIDRSRVAVNVICYEGKVYTRTEQEIEALCAIKYLNAKGKITLNKIRYVFAALRESKPDVVHVHLGGMAYAVPWSLLNGIPLLITAHTKPSQAFIPMVLPLIKWGLKHHRIRIAAVSQENTVLMKDYFGLDDERIVCVNNGIDLDRYYQLQHSCFTYINVARQDTNKNQAAILRAFTRIISEGHSARLLLAGNGPTHESLKLLADELNISNAVEFLGEISDAERYYAVSDAYVQSSHREAMPMSVLEAMASRLPIISTDVGGLRDVVHGNGILIHDNDEEALYLAMIAVLKMSYDELEVMKKSSWENVQEYSAKNMAIQYCEIYCSMRKKRE